MPPSPDGAWAKSCASSIRRSPKGLVYTRTRSAVEQPAIKRRATGTPAVLEHLAASARPAPLLGACAGLSSFPRRRLERLDV